MILSKIKLIIWKFFNKKKYKEYIKTHSPKLYIFNKFYMDIDGVWNLLTISSDNKVLNHFGIRYEKLADTYQYFTFDISLMYDETLNRRYEIITLLPNDEEPELFKELMSNISIQY